MFNKIASRVCSFLLLATISMYSQAKEKSSHENEPADTTAQILVSEFLKPWRNNDKYNFYITESFFKAKNHFPDLYSKASSQATSLAFFVRENHRWRWGVAYMYYADKWHGFEDNWIERSTSHGFTPTVTYSFNDEVHITVMGGGRFSAQKISQVKGVLATGKTHGRTGTLGAQLDLEKELGLCNLSVAFGTLYEKSKTNKYTLTDGEFTPKESTHFLQGATDVQLGFNIHKNFQPYVKTGYKNVLRRSSNYSIENHYGWSVGGGADLFSAEKWSSALDYEYNKAPEGSRGSTLLLKLAASF